MVFWSLGGLTVYSCMQWYAIPAVANMEVSVGGILFTGIPFSGWYADSEIVRNMSDEGRYNMLPEIARRLGMAVSDNRSLWKDAALVVLNQVCFGIRHWGHTARAARRASGSLPSPLTCRTGPPGTRRACGCSRIRGVP